MPRYKPHTRESIERIRETINTERAVKTLHEIGHDKKAPPSVRVKALQVLLDKTLPSLTQADITNIQGEQVDYSALTARLTELLGPDAGKILNALGKPSPERKETHEQQDTPSTTH